MFVAYIQNASFWAINLIFLSSWEKKESQKRWEGGGGGGNDQNAQYISLQEDVQNYQNIHM